MPNQQAASGKAATDQLAEDFERFKKFLGYLQESAARGDRADDAQLASLNMARTPNRVWYTENSARVLEYEVLGEPARATPILMIYSFINRWYILDLQPGHSFIEALSKAGFKVYMLDWGIPGPEHAQLGFDYHLEGLALRAARRIARRHGGRPINLFGYCLGGTLAAIMAALHPDLYANLVLLTTPLDAEDAGLLGLWTNKEFFKAEKISEAFGCVPEKLLHAPFPLLRPRASLAKTRTLFENINNDEYLKSFRAIDRWATDNVPFPGRAFHEFIRDCYQENLLARGGMRVAGKPVEMAAIRCPVLNIFATQDDVVPTSAPIKNAALLRNASVTDRQYEAGHITLTVGHPIRHQVWADTIQWLGERDCS